MSAHAPRLPRLLLEDYMALLYGLVLSAWMGLLLAVMTQATLKASGQAEWPGLGTFSATYTAVLIEFGINTLALTALLFYRDWYERVPRDSAQRVRWLLVFVLLWFSLHLFAAFHVTGSVQGPLLLLLPVLLIAALLGLPGALGWALVAYLLLGHLAVLILEQTGWISARGGLAPHFSLHGESSAWAVAAIICVCLAAVALAVAIRRWLYPGAESLSPAQRIDPNTGLFRRSFLQHRVKMELGRVRRQGGSAALLMIGLEQPDYKRMPVLAAALRGQIRIGSDTPAIYQQGVMAVLLPTTGEDVVQGVAKRIVQGVEQAANVTGQLRSSVSIASHQEIDADSLLIAAEAALQAAEAGGPTVIVAD